MRLSSQPILMVTRNACSNKESTWMTKKGLCTVAVFQGSSQGNTLFIHGWWYIWYVMCLHTIHSLMWQHVLGRVLALICKPIKPDEWGVSMLFWNACVPSGQEKKTGSLIVLTRNLHVQHIPWQSALGWSGTTSAVLRVWVEGVCRGKGVPFVGPLFEAVSCQLSSPVLVGPADTVQISTPRPSTQVERWYLQIVDLFQVTSGAAKTPKPFLTLPHHVE